MWFLALVLGGGGWDGGGRFRMTLFLDFVFLLDVFTLVDDFTVLMMVMIVWLFLDFCVGVELLG